MSMKGWPAENRSSLYSFKGSGSSTKYAAGYVMTCDGTAYDIKIARKWYRVTHKPGNLVGADEYRKYYGKLELRKASDHSQLYKRVCFNRYGTISYDDPLCLCQIALEFIPDLHDGGCTCDAVSMAS